MRLFARPVLLLAGVVLLAACGASGPADSFDRHGNRLYERYDATGDDSRDVRVPAGTRVFHVSVDCAGPGTTVELEIEGIGAGSGGGCSDEPNSREVATLTTPKPLSASTRTVTVRVEGDPVKDVRWSAALDVSD